jgi:F-type H+-transporting ATPase subunit b
MRIRTPIIPLSFSIVAVGLVALVAWAPAAHAGEAPTLTAEQQAELTHEAETLAQENGGTEFDAECVKTLVEGGKVDDCQEAPSPILPETSELVWGVISFVVLLGALWKFAYPGLKKGMEGRTERIRSDLDAADGAKAEAEQVLTDYRAQLADAKGEAGRIIEEARQAADALKRDAESRLQAELAELRTRAQADIEASKAQAIADLRGEVANLAIGAAEIVVQRSLDRQSQTQLVEDYINQVAATRG